MLGKLLKIPFVFRLVLWLLCLCAAVWILPRPSAGESTAQVAIGVGLMVAPSIALLCSVFPKQARAARAAVLFRARPWFFKNVLSAGFAGAVTGVLGVYNTAENIWGKKISFFTSYTEIHDQVKFWSLMIIMIFAVGLYFKERWKEGSLVGTEAVLRSFVLMSGNVVEKKIERLLDIAKQPAAARRGPANELPQLQLRTIFTESAAFLRASFNLLPHQVDITILEKKDSGVWSFQTCHQSQWQHEDANHLFTPTSCAHRAITTGQQVFYASKSIAAEEGEYDLGRRDAEFGDGSIFCVPLKISCRGTTLSYIVSIVTYGRALCDPGDSTNQEKTLTLLRQIIRRIELELHQRALSIIK